MLEVIICTCGKDLGSLIDVYDYCSNIIKEQYKEKYLKEKSIDRIMWDPKWDVELGSLMDTLNIKLDCCRMNMLSKIKISKISIYMKKNQYILTF